MNRSSRPAALFLALFCALPATADVPSTLPATSAPATSSAQPQEIPPAQLIDSPFGIGSSAQRSRDLEDWIPKMTAIGIHVLRGVGGGGWNGTIPDNFDGMDAKLEYLATQHVYAGAIFYNYRKDKSKKGLPVDDLPGWTAFVTKVVSHSKGKIKYWELWNEPPNGTKKTQTPQDYARYVVATYDAAKAADPDCLIGLAAKSVDLNYLYQAIQAGAKDHFDYITLHPYETFGCAIRFPGAEPIYMAIAPTVHKMLADIDPAKQNCPIIFTEVGVDSRHGVDAQGEAVVKCYTMGIAQGITCIQWFEGMDGDSGPLGLIDARGRERPAYHGLANLIQALGEQPNYLGWALLNDKDYGFVFQGPKGATLVTWARAGTTDPIDFGQNVQITNPLTGAASSASAYTLTNAPIIVTGAPDKIVAQAQTNKGKPFPWGGDYTGATSVSIQMGQTNIEKGLHTQSADSVAADVVAYGGSARVGNIPGGSVYMVDPNFLSYTATPIEIDVVCRRNESNDPASIKLEYESTSGFKKLDPYDIPDNTDWHTAKFTINDAQFVSMYGFSFRMDPGKYFIQSVTVTKVK